MELKSKIINKKEIDWSRVIKLDELKIDPTILQAHKERVNTIFKNLTTEQRQQQIDTIVVRDNLFNKAMDYLVSDYEIEFDNEDIDLISAQLAKQFNQPNSDIIKEIAKKYIIKTLIFKDIQQEHSISISDDELIKILKDYYEQTNQPIRDFMKDEEKFASAKNTLLEEKTTAFIIDKFPRDLTELQRKIYESLAEKQKQEQENNIENQTTTNNK